jgi:membrane protein
MRAVLGRVVDRLKRTLVFRFVGEYGASNAGSFSSGLAFNAFMSLFPMVLGILAIIGLVLGGTGLQSEVSRTLVSAFPTSARPSISSAISHLHDVAGVFGILSVLGLLWAGTNFFSSLEFALSQIFHIKQRDFLRQRAMGVVMILVLTVALVIDVGVNALMNLLPFMAALGPVLGAIDMVVLMLLVYRFVPNRTFRFAQIWSGALVAGILTEAITLLFPLYAKLVHGFNAYGQVFALFFLLATWLGFVAQFILIGAVWNRVLLGERYDAIGLVATPRPKPEAKPSPGAQPAPSGGAPTQLRPGGSAAPAGGHGPVASTPSASGGGTIRRQ